MLQGVAVPVRHKRSGSDGSLLDACVGGVRRLALTCTNLHLLHIRRGVTGGGAFVSFDRYTLPGAKAASTDASSGSQGTARSDPSPLSLKESAPKEKKVGEADEESKQPKLGPEDEGDDRPKQAAAAMLTLPNAAKVRARGHFSDKLHSSERAYACGRLSVGEVYYKFTTLRLTDAGGHHTVPH